MLHLHDVVFGYSRGLDRINVLDRVSMTFHPGVSAIMGPSGSGKTTLLRAVAGQLEIGQGQISIDDTGVRYPSDPRVTLIHQDHHLVEFLNVEDNIRLAAELRGYRISLEQIDGLLNSVSLGGYGQRMPSSLSGGQQQRAAIARALSTRCRVLVADEPTGALDRTNSNRVAEVLKELGSRGTTVVLVATHDATVAAILGNTVEIVDGSLVTKVPT